MVDISAQCILDVWEQGASSTPEGRAQALLGLVQPELSTQALLELILGERNKNLLGLRQQLYGSKLQAYIECGKCGEALDLEFSIDEIGLFSNHDLADIHSVSIANLNFKIRLPNSNDLHALADLRNIEDGRRLLFSRCVIEVQRDSSEITINELSENELDELEKIISEIDPRMEIVFDLRCPQCSHTWQSPLEIGTFVWSEYDVYARQLLEQVHILASRYAWSESEILRMSEQRRQYYLQRIIQ